MAIHLYNVDFAFDRSKMQFRRLQFQSLLWESVPCCQTRILH